MLSEDKTQVFREMRARTQANIARAVSQPVQVEVTANAALIAKLRRVADSGEVRGTHYEGLLLLAAAALGGDAS